MVGLAAGQLTGTALLIGGLARSDDERAAAVIVQPVAALSIAGIALSGRFSEPTACG